MKTLTFIPKGKHFLVKELGLLCSLPIIKPVVEIADYSTGGGYSAHPNIDRSGSVSGMKKLGYWRKEDVTFRQGEYIFNISKVSCSNPLDELCYAIEQNNYKCDFLTNGTRVYHF